MKLLDRLLSWVSWLSIGALMALALVEGGGIWRLPAGWLRVWLVPILAAAAIGYVTNWLAIWFLFRPYQRHGLLWGVVPRNQARLAAALGRVIPERLLPPEQQTEMFFRLICKFLEHHDLLHGMRRSLGAILRAKTDVIAGFAVPRVLTAIRVFCDSSLTAERVGGTVGRAIEEYLAVPEHRLALSQIILGEVEESLPALTAYLKANIKGGVERYLKESKSMFAFALPMIGSIIDGLDWDRIQGQIAEALQSPDCQARLAEKLTGVGNRLAEALSTPATAAALRRHIQDTALVADGPIATTLHEQMPQMLQGLMENDAIWEAAAEHVVPYLREQIRPMLANRAEEIAATLDLAGRIEAAVNGLEVPDMHRTVLEVAGQELLWLQVLGFFLGGMAGALMAVVR